MRRAFTLIELLVVIWVLALLAALLFPVIQTARRKGQEVGCISNQHQTGVALTMYLSDYDSQYPIALDPSEKVFPTYIGAEPEFSQYLASAPYFHDVMHPYVKSREIFHCPSDTGYQIDDWFLREFPSYPTSFQAHGTSYEYNPALVNYTPAEAEISLPAQTPIQYDAASAWHGSVVPLQRKRLVLFADNHVKKADRALIVDYFSEIEQEFIH